MATTVNVLVKATDQNNGPVANARVTAKLSHDDIDATYGYIVPEEIVGTTDASGQVTLALWPNELGSTSSYYDFKITNPDTAKTIRLTATIPNSDCQLHLVADLPPYPGKSDGQLVIDAAVAAVAPAVAARDAAIAAQEAADADVVLTHADVVSTHADVLLTHADAAATAADRVQTGLDSAAAEQARIAAEAAQAGAESAVSTAIANVIDGAPAALDTLNELAAALADDANFAATMANALAGKQPLDDELTAIAGLVSAADKIAYFTGAGTAALADFTPQARTFAAAADAAAQRTVIGIPSITDDGTTVSLGSAFKAVAVASAVNFVQATAAIAGGGPGVSFRGSDTNVTGTYLTQGSGSHRFFTNLGFEQFRVSHTASAVNYIEAKGAATAGIGLLSVKGSDVDIPLGFSSKGTQRISFYTDYGGATGGEQLRVSYTASAVNYVQATGAAAGSGVILSGQGSDSNVNLSITAKGTGDTALRNSGGGISFVGSAPASAVNYLQATGAATSAAVRLAAAGSDANIWVNYYAKGSATHQFLTNNAVQFRITDTASAVNFLQATGGATGNSATLSAQGSDTDVTLTLASKGARSVVMQASGASQFVVSPTASAVNYVKTTGSVAGSPLFVSADGSDARVDIYLKPKGSTGLARLADANGLTHISTGAVVASADTLLTVTRQVGYVDLAADSGTAANCDIRLSPRGTGNVQFGTLTANADAPITGYITIKDSGGTLRKLAVIA